jgi:hypothetical protein
MTTMLYLGHSKQIIVSLQFKYFISIIRRPDADALLAQLNWEYQSYASRAAFVRSKLHKIVHIWLNYPNSVAF